MIVPEAAMQILKDHPEGLTAKQVTDEIISRKLYAFSAKDPVQIVARSMNRHCLGIDRSYACQERFFSVSKDNTGTLVFKLLPGVWSVSCNICISCNPISPGKPLIARFHVLFGISCGISGPV